MKWHFSLLALALFTVLSLSCAQSNTSPVISSVHSSEAVVVALGSSQMACVASDADGDSLTYDWSASGGAFSGGGPVVTWTAPDRPGTYTITVRVTDGRGGKTSRQIAVEVPENRAPIIRSLTAEPPVVNQGQDSVIGCDAFDPDGDEIRYVWTASNGTFFGEGATVIWTAPVVCGNHIIKVAVSDGRGGESSKEISITVKKPG